MTGLTRREAIRLGGAGVLALTVPGCGSAALRATAGAPAEWRQFQGTTLNFISENTAPTSAIAANLKPFEDLTGIRIKITQLELAALVQKVALDFASGQGAYQIVYADPYQVLAPYHEALVDLTTMMHDPNLPKLEDVGDFIPTQLDAAGRFVDKGKLYALPYDAPTMIWQYRKDLFQKYGSRMKQDLGFDPTPSDSSTWDEFYKTSKWFRENAKQDVPYGHGHQAKQHDSLMNDFSNVLWAYGGDYFKNGVAVGQLGSLDPGEPVLDSAEAIQAADVYRRLVSIAHPGSLGWDWDGLGAAFAAGEMAMAVNWHEFAASNETSKIKGKVGYARLPRGPKRSANMYGGTGLGINATASPREQKAAWLFVNWATSKKVQLANLKSKVGGGTPTRDSVYRLPEVQKAKHPPSSMPNILTADAVFEAWRPENIGLRPKIAAWNECDTAIFTQLSKMLAGQQSPDSCMANTKQGFVEAIDNAASLRNA
ncbi:MAG: multiple sugar transport system substrate-binding protein [Solirubrobacteraceae bacterium]|nr:multiple sugar transport system substrate-binding protein [Solirubrobacteraceae bacterium]